MQRRRGSGSAAALDFPLLSSLIPLVYALKLDLPTVDFHHHSQTVLGALPACHYTTHTFPNMFVFPSLLSRF